ncbi:MAG: HupE/UreJ family protein [Pseudomonadota bacterium]
MILRGLTRLLLLLLLATPAAFGHEVRPAYLQITELPQPEDADVPLFNVLWKQPIVQNGRLAIDPVFPSDCQSEEIGPPEFTPSALLHRWRLQCDLLNGAIHISGLSVTLTDVMVNVVAGGESKNYILRPASATLDLRSDAAPAASYLVIGIEHLVFGIDHVLFVLGLVLFIRDRWMLLKTITAFTIAHSITLVMSVMKWVQLDQGPVEAIIALSILFLARELAAEPERRSRLTQGAPWIMAFVFGLLHGLGFAGALADIGLPEDSLWLSLLLFNLGIEVGQIMIIAVLFVLGWLAKRITDLQLIARYGAYAMGTLAAYWTIDRTLLLM